MPRSGGAPRTHGWVACASGSARSLSGRRDGRAAECEALEKPWDASPRGFKSHSLRVTSVAAVADEYVERSAALDPASATQAGIVGHDHELTDYSPAGIDARVQLARETLRALESASLEGDRERVARELLRERLSVQIDQSEAGEDLRALRPMASPLEAVRVAFDLMPTATDDDWATIEARMAQVPAALAGFTESLRLGLARGLPAARRQALACAEQAVRGPTG